jgi:hypothetical protein
VPRPQAATSAAGSCKAALEESSRRNHGSQQWQDQQQQPRMAAVTGHAPATKEAVRGSTGAGR